VFWSKKTVGRREPYYSLSSWTAGVGFGGWGGREGEAAVECGKAGRKRAAAESGKGGGTRGPLRSKAIYNTGQINSPENTAPWMLEAALALLSLRSL